MHQLINRSIDFLSHTSYLSPLPLSFLLATVLPSRSRSIGLIPSPSGGDAGRRWQRRGVGVA
jgi:hypothetical protein